jgi:hypothetical protein
MKRIFVWSALFVFSAILFGLRVPLTAAAPAVPANPAAASSDTSTATMAARSTPAVAAALHASATQSSSAQSASKAASSGAFAALPVTAGPLQPIPFSHKIHAGRLKIECKYCHQPRKSGATLTIPQAADCMVCHRTLATSDPGVQRLAGYAKRNQLIPWVRVYQLPSFVHFSHKAHTSGGVTCQECHGDVAQQTHIFKASDISMGGCLKCHEAKKAPISCDTCHEIDD